jgi:short-subunit dehydrogenase
MIALRDELGVKAKIISADLATSEGIDAVRAALAQEKVSVSYLVNAAGFGNLGSFDELSENEVAGMIDLNVKATVLLTHLVVPYMERGGRIVELGSGSCFTPLPYFNVYSSSKVFVLHYTKSLNYELKRYGIRATCLCPGWVETEFLGKAKANGKTHPRAMKPTLKCEAVVAKCIKAMKRGKAMCVTNWYTKMQHVLFKILPDFILTRLWLGMREHPKEDAENGEN